jgi:hypothetical protein
MSNRLNGSGEPLLPDEFGTERIWGDVPELKDLAPERRLIAAQLSRGVRDLMGGEDVEPTNDKVSWEVANDARDWVRERSDRERSFDWCCQELGWDPDQRRAQIRRWLTAQGRPEGWLDAFDSDWERTKLQTHRGTLRWIATQAEQQDLFSC